MLASFCLALLAGCASIADLPAGDTNASVRYGVLLMAHGGSPKWNQSVTEAVMPLREKYPIEPVFGMADAASIQEGVRKLESQGVRHIGVVRLFISGESWFTRTEQILGLRAGAPERAPARTQLHDEHGGDHAAQGHSMEFFRVPTQSAFAVSTLGLSQAPEMGTVLAERARTLSRHPDAEDVLILAHGPGDDGENARLLREMDRLAQSVRASAPFHHVEVQTLREDWPERRALATQRIRTFVSTAAADGRQVIVIPFRVSGFGPYAEVLTGLDYVADGRGLLPHPAVTRWIDRQAEALRAQLFRRPGQRQASR